MCHSWGPGSYYYVLLLNALRYYVLLLNALRATMYYYYVLLDGRGAGWRVVGNALRAVHVRVKFFLRHRFPWKFPETVFFRASQISERISGNLDQSQIVRVS